MRESQCSESEVNLPMPDLFTASYQDETVKPQRHVIIPESATEHARFDHTGEISGPIICNESHIDTARTPVAETQVTNPEQTILSTSVGDRKTYCRSTNIQKIYEHCSTQSSTTGESKSSACINIGQKLEHNQDTTHFDRNNKDALAHIESKIGELLQTMENKRQCVEDTGLQDGNVDGLDKQQVNNKPQQNGNKNMEQRNTDVQGETEQGGSERSSKRKRLRRRQKKQQHQSEISWSEDVKDYKGYRPIDELVKFITG